MIRPILAVLALFAGTTHADLLVYPGCGATLQSCLDAAKAGDTVQIAADVTPKEQLLVTRSVTIEPAPGTAPVLALDTSITVRPTGTAATDVTVRDLTFRGGWIDVVHEEATALTATITGNRFLHGGPVPIVTVGEPVKESQTPYGALRATITDNVLVADLADTSNGIVVVARYASSLTAVVARNTLEVVGPQQGGVLIGTGVSSAYIDAIGNRVSGDTYGAGVAVTQVGGVMRARIVNNEITEQGADGGSIDALYVNTEGGSADALVLNNSVVGNGDGMLVYGSAPEHIRATVANNVVVGNTRRGLTLAPWIDNSNNVIFGNGVDAFVPGPNTKIVDPLFVPGTLWLRDDSPARDAGATDLVPADITTDIGGTRRVAGGVVDVGAHEHPCPGCDPDPTPVVCDDADPCTDDAVDAGVCRHVPVTGIAALVCTCTRGPAAACAGQQPPDAVRRKTDRACALVGGTTSRKIIKKATKQWSAALRQARSRATRRRVGEACAGALASGLGDTVARARTLLAAP